jgi:hypothetical protein
MRVAKEFASCKLDILGLQVFRCGVHATLSYFDKNLTVVHLRNLELRVFRV